MTWTLVTLKGDAATARAALSMIAALSMMPSIARGRAPVWDAYQAVLTVDANSWCPASGHGQRLQRRRRDADDNIADIGVEWGVSTCCTLHPQ